MDQIQLISFTEKKDQRGTLTYFETGSPIPFQIARVFYIRELGTLPRGLHANKISQEVLIPITGSFKIELTDGQATETYQLDRGDQGLLVPAGIWLTMTNFSADCVILVLCSYRYDPTEAIRDFNEYLQYRSELTEKSQHLNCFSLQGQIDQCRPELFEKFEQTLDNQQFILGQELEQFEQAYAQYNDSQYCIGVSSGTSALVCALKSLSIPAGSEVLIQANAFIAAPLAIEATGLKIKIVEVDENLNVDLDDLEQKITDQTRVIIVVHLYGMCPDMDRLMAIQKKYGLFLIEDTAQAHGSTYRGKKLGSFGDLGCFSFYPSKNLGCLGDGGCVVTDNFELAQKIQKYRNYGGLKKYEHQTKGLNERLDTLQAAFLNVKLKYLDGWNQRKGEIADRYDQLLAQVSEVRIPANDKNLQRAYHLYVVLVTNRDELIAFLNERNIYPGIHYPETFYRLPNFSDLGQDQLETRADDHKDKLLSLPLYPELTCDDVKRIVNTIIEFYDISNKNLKQDK